MTIVWFIGYLILAHFVLMQVFRFATYHAYFWFALPAVVALAVGVAWVMYKYLPHGFFLWYIVLESIWLLLGGRKQSAQSRTMLEMLSADADQDSTMIKSFIPNFSLLHAQFSSLHYIFFYWVSLASQSIIMLLSHNKRMQSDAAEPRR